MPIFMRLDFRGHFVNKHSSLWDLGYTPVNVSALTTLLQNYPNKTVADQLLHGFTFGFSLNYTGPRGPVSCKNMVSASENKDQLLGKLNKEIQLGRIVGPFDVPPFKNFHCSPIGVLPKKQGGFRLITNLSAPRGNSINEFIDPEICSVNYSSFDQAVNMVQNLGANAQLGKMDISNAFRLLPIRPEDFSLLGFKFLDKYYVDKCLPMGCAISCALFEKFSTFLHWSVEQHSNLNSIVHYLDDFLFAGAQGTGNCSILMDSFQQICYRLGVPLSDEKTEGPTTYIVFLGLGLDSVSTSIFIPKEKVEALKKDILQIQGKSKVTLKQLQSLAGSLAFVTRALPAGRTFTCRIYGLMSGVSKPYHFVRLTREIHSDLQMWLKFLNEFNGTTKFPDLHWESDKNLHFYSDSSGSVGCGVIFGSSWSYLCWPEEWNTVMRNDITFLEFVPIVLGFYLWSDKFQNKKLILHVDNLALVEILNQKTSKNKRVMTFMRELVLLSLKFNIQIKAVHISGYRNEIADSISRLQWRRFRQLAPWADCHPYPVPTQFWSLLKGMSIV